MDLAELRNKSNDELLELAVELGVAEANGNVARRQELLGKVLNAYAEQNVWRWCFQ